MSAKEIRHRLKGVRDKPIKTSKGVSATQFVERTGDIRVYIDGKYEQVGFLNVNTTSPIVLTLVSDIVSKSKLRRVK